MSSEIAAQRNYWNGEANAFNKIYSHEKSSLANFLDRVFRRDMYQRFEFTMEQCKPYSRLSYLDIGCGSGVYSLELARRGARRVTGLDIAENMVNFCRQSASNKGFAETCSFLHTDLLAFDPKATFDVSIGIGLFDYIKEAAPVLARMRDLTASHAVMSFPRFWTWRAPIRKARLSLRGCGVYFYTRRKIRRLLTEAGFSGYKIVRVGKLHCVVAYS